MSADIENERTLRRHDSGTRLLHAAVVLVVAMIIFSGFGLAGLLPEPVLRLLGGHVWFDTMHHVIGLVFGVALVFLVILAPAQTRGFARDIVHFGKSDWRWPLAFLRFSLRPRKRQPPWHAGRFDPVQRLVFLAATVSLALLIVSGALLYFVSSSGARLLLAWTVQTHTYATVVFIVSICIHILAGSGLLPTHRGVARAMFGNGRVRLSLGQRLWPSWTIRRDASSNSHRNPPSACNEDPRTMSPPGNPQ